MNVFHIISGILRPLDSTFGNDQEEKIKPGDGKHHRFDSQYIDGTRHYVMLGTITILTLILVKKWMSA